MTDPQASTLVVTESGAVFGRIARDAVDDWAAIRLLWTAKGTGRVRDVTADLAIQAAGDRRGVATFVVTADPAPDPGSELRLVSVAGGATKEMVRGVEGAAVARIEAIHDDGSVTGWCVGGGGPSPLDLMVNELRVASVLADRFSPVLTTPERTAFHDFQAALPFALFAMMAADTRMSLRSRAGNETLFSATVGELRRAGSPAVAALPVNVIALAPVDAIVDRAGVDFFHEKHGAERFVEAAYHYILERPADADGRQSFASALVSGAVTPEELLRTMYGSEERRARGALLGPFVGDVDYPFPDPSLASDGGGARSRSPGRVGATTLPLGKGYMLGGEQPTTLLVSGWGDPEPGWRWVLGTSAVMRFALEQPATCDRLRVHCRSVGLLTAGNTVVITLNGTPLGERRLEDDAWTDLDFAIPTGVAEEVNEMWIDTGQATSVPGDHRSLSICVCEIQLG